MAMSSEPKIIYENEVLVVLEKPAGLPSCPRSPKEPDPHTLEGWLQKKYPEAKLVHRLDNDTSGLVIAAKDEKNFKKMREVWNGDEVVKSYIVLVIGHPPESDFIDSPISHHPRKPKKMQIGGKGSRPAYTEYRVLKTFNDFSLVKARITTGVRHQLRVHFSSIGHPVAGDNLYKRNSIGVETDIKFDRQFLHLSSIELKSVDQKWSSELPKDLEKILEKLRS